MLRVVICDDEYIVLEGLRSMIEWSDYGMSLVGTAEDGKAAWALIRELRPDIVMTDIRMPGIDGLRLIELVMEEAPETVCIVFSGFNEYEYVRTAMKLGVVDYLEKPITLEKVDEALRRTCERIGGREELAALRRAADASREALLEQATLALLRRGAEALPRWRACFGEEEADRVAAVTVIAGEVPDGALEEALAPLGGSRTVVVADGDERLAAVFHFACPDDAGWEEARCRLSELPDAAGAGLTYSGVADAVRSRTEALRALRFARFMEERGLTRYAHIAESGVFPEGLTDREEAILFDIRTGDKEGLHRDLDAFSRWMEQERLDPELAEQEILKLAYVGRRSGRETVPGAQRAAMTARAVPHRELAGLQTRDEMFRWLRGQLETVFAKTAEERQASQHAAVAKALDFIGRHFRRDLTLQEVADHVGMNTTYFSLLFKEKTGASYIKHVTRLRLDEAKLLLREGKRVNEASEAVGYYNYRHFTELFKKHVGMTPGQYRDDPVASVRKEADHG
ncbi:two-component system, response regulator YesN [Cohnella sp. OV330]|uniref:response regulator n=1 Tax=Cohnella sp. OV330 TaxID=1855288 RepID=UPI0008EEDD3F|nr:response regulator [Cohnella sp. OV330]SFB06143.1 two-component system, response regulator YesN [Cohnella sp. OV330]